MQSAIFGLLGVVLGAGLTFLREWWLQRQNDQKEVRFLLTKVACELEKYINQCAEVVSDDGLYQGQADKEGCRVMQVIPPTFDPMSFGVEWRLLPTDLMYEVLDFPYKAEIASKTVSAVSEESFPPDYGEAFEERQFQYAVLGISASQLAAKLRKHAGLPERSHKDWDPVSYMKKQKLAIESNRTNRSSLTY